MNELEKIRPTQCRRVIDLLRDAGLDVSDWANFKGGASCAARNPRYCYEWSFIQPGRVIVLNIWHSLLEEVDGQIIYKGNTRRQASTYSAVKHKSTWAKRALNFDKAVQSARQGLPVRAIICDGRVRRIDDPQPKPSEVRARDLDLVTWAVTSHDADTGDFQLTRNSPPNTFIDQFAMPGPIGAPTETTTITGSAFVRDPSVRRAALNRAHGRCQWCGQQAFTTDDGAGFLETHHIVPLSEGGQDNVMNVVALCPNHHREAHYGLYRATMKDTLLKAPKQ